MIEFLKAKAQKHFQIIRNLAEIIWHEHYTPIIGRNQVIYMLYEFQSTASISRQITEGYLYFIITYETKSVGYICIKKDGDSLFLSKIYLLKSKRGKGIGSRAMQFIESQAKRLNCNSITLTVNKNNSKSIKAYEAMGFITSEAIVMDIGAGYVMDDYKMKKYLK